MNNDKELFEKHIDLSMSKRIDKEINADHRLMTFNQFLSALSERDKERVCKNCEHSGHCLIEGFIIKQQDKKIMIEFDFGCNQFEARAK